MRIPYITTVICSTLTLFTISTARADELVCGEGCATIEWGMKARFMVVPAWIPVLWYTNCQSGKQEKAGGGALQYSGRVCAKLGSDINLGPQATLSNYTSGMKVQPGRNPLECWGLVGSTGKCQRIDLHLR